MNDVYEDAFDLICGECIGEGSQRKVFSFALDETKVVKVETSDYRDFSNIKEWAFWQDNLFCEKVAKWLAPCHFISPDGRILIQSKADRLPSNFDIPEKLPAFLTDLKKANFGLISGQLVCVDYAMTISSPNTRLSKFGGWHE